MSDGKKDILLIGDTFVFNLQMKNNLENESEHMESLTEQFLQKVGFENSFVKALREDFQQDALADTITDLLNSSTNPAMLHLSSALESEGFTYDIVNCSLRHREQLLELLSNVKYGMIGISTTYTLERAYIVNLIKLIKRYAPETKIILGGMHIVKIFKLQKDKDLQKALQQIDADYFVFNEVGERPLIDILRHNQSASNDIENLPNVAYRTQNGFKINPFGQNDINDSVSDWSLSPNTVYAFLRTSKSCLFKCKFCDFPVIADTFKSKNIDVVLQEFENIEKAGIKFVRFLDDTFNLPKKHFNEILNSLVNNDYGFEWISYIRCQYLDDETVKLMKKSGCIGVFLGIESGNNEILKNMDKRSTVEEYFKGISLLQKHDIPTYGAFIVGFPGETDETVEDTIKFIKKAKFDYYRLFTWDYSDIAPIASEKEKYSLQVFEDGWKHATMSSSEAVDKCKHIMKEVNDSLLTTISYDYTLYLNRNPETRQVFRECLKRFNKLNIDQF